MAGNQEIFQQAMNQGHSAAWDQLWDRAAVFYRQALNEFPDHPKALMNLGLALYEMQEYDQALQYYQRAARAAQEDPVPMEKVAQLFERQGNITQATQSYLRAAELHLKNRDVKKAIDNWGHVLLLDPENLSAHSRLALVYERMGDAARAATEYLAVASLFQGAGDMDRAVSSVNKALQLVPNSDEAIQALATLRDFKQLPKPTRPRGGTAPLRMAQVRQLEAPKSVEQLSGLDPITQARQQALTILAGMLFEGTDEEDTVTRGEIGDLMRGRGKGKNEKRVDRTRVSLHLSQVVDAQTHERNSVAMEELERAVEAGLSHPAAFFDLGYLYAEAGRYDYAQRNLQYAVTYPELALGARLLMGDVLRKLERINEASVEYLQALKIADSQVVPQEQADLLRQLYEPLIESVRQQNDLEFQTRLCENIQELLMRPDWRAHLNRARAQLGDQDGESPPMPIAEILTEARSSQVVESLANIYKLARNGYLHSAMEEAFFTLQYAPTYLPLHSYMGELLRKQGLLQDAITKLMVVARTFTIRGEPQRAMDIYRKIGEWAPMDLNARSRLIELLISQNNNEAAIQEYYELADTYYNLADLVMARKTYTEALRLAQQSRVDSSFRVQILHRMADIDLQSLDWRQALRIYEQIRTQEPADEKARYSLIELNYRLGQEQQALVELDSYLGYLVSNNQREQALEFLRNIVHENPERLAVRRRLAELYRQVGQRKEAIEELDAIGEALLEAGDRGGAIKVVERILSLNPPNTGDYKVLLETLKER